MRQLVLAFALLAVPLAALAQTPPDGQYYLVGDHGAQILGAVSRGRFLTCQGNVFKISDYVGMRQALKSAGKVQCPEVDDGDNSTGASADAALEADQKSPQAAAEDSWVRTHFHRKQPAGSALLSSRPGAGLR